VPVVYFVVCSVRNCRVSVVVLWPTDISGVVQPRYLGWRHYGAYRRVISGIRPCVQGGGKPLRLETPRAVDRWWHIEHLLVWCKGNRYNFRQRRKLHVRVAQAWFWTDRRTTGWGSVADTITHTRYYGTVFTRMTEFCFSRIDAISISKWIDMGHSTDNGRGKNTWGWFTTLPGNCPKFFLIWNLYVLPNSAT